MPASQARFRMVDRSGEQAELGFFIPEITALNHDAVVGAGGNVEQLHAVVAGMSLCNFRNQRVVHSDAREIPSLPSDDNAQREKGIEITWYDTVEPNAPHRVYVPGGDWAGLTQPNTDEIDIESNVSAIAWKAAIELNAVSDKGNPITVTRMRVVGRNS